MYEDPQDMFREMDELFTHLYTRITRNFAAGDPQVFGYHMIIQQDGETLCNAHIHRATNFGQPQNRWWKFTGLVMR